MILRPMGILSFFRSRNLAFLVLRIHVTFLAWVEVILAITLAMSFIFVVIHTALSFGSERI